MSIRHNVQTEGDVDLLNEARLVRVLRNDFSSIFIDSSCDVHSRNEMCQYNVGTRVSEVLRRTHSITQCQASVLNGGLSHSYLRPNPKT